MVKMRLPVAFFVLMTGVLAWDLATLAAADGGVEMAGETWRIVPSGRLDLQIWRGNDYLFSLEADVRQPAGTRRPNLEAMPTAGPQARMLEEDVYFYTWGDPKPVAGPLQLRYEARRSDPRVLQLRIRCQSREALQLEGVRVALPSLDLSYYLKGGHATATMRDGEKVSFPLPHTVHRANLGDQVQSIRLANRMGELIDLEFGEPVSATYEGHTLAVWLVRGSLLAGQPRQLELTVHFPHPVEFETANRFVDTSRWFRYEGRQDFRTGSAIGAEEWLERPAGKRGFVQIDEARGGFMFEDGAPVKFWGTNISWADMALPDEQAVRYADKFAKHGVNLVRFHKFLDQPAPRGLVRPDDRMDLDEDVARRFDSMHARLRERGIYVGWSPLFVPRFHESFRDRLIDYDELKRVREAHPTRLGDTLYLFSTFAPDVQDLYIELVTRTLNRVNVHTGRRYADDPALAFVEFHNEASTFFWTVDNMARHSPVYRRILSRKFCDWLRERYPSEEALRAAWTEIGLEEDESLEEGTIFPFPGWGRINQTPHARRLIDSYRFLFEFQDGFYQRFVRAVRETGYRGALVGSCWWAADWLGHLYNLASDRRVGPVDRHRYFGGGNRPMIGQPGYSLLGIGMEVVRDRPFQLSEWAGGHIHAAELPPTIAFIGLGLQGWDSSNQFASNWWGINMRNQPGINTTSDVFYNIGQFPLIARILYSDALRQGKVVARRRISMGDLYPLDRDSAEDFKLMGDTVWDELERAVPREALGAGRVEIEFTEEPVPDKLQLIELERYLDVDNRIIHASNDQIVWDYSGRGFFTVNTPAGVAVIGFGGGREHALGAVRVSYDVPFANVYVVPRHPGENLVEARSLVVMTLARTADEGDVLEDSAMRPFKTAELEQVSGGTDARIRHILENPTLLFEPVTVAVTLERKDPCRVYALDHDGRLPIEPAAVPVIRGPRGQTFILNGRRYRTMYYLVEFQNP